MADQASKLRQLVGDKIEYEQAAPAAVAEDADVDPGQAPEEEGEDAETDSGQAPEEGHEEEQARSEAVDIPASSGRAALSILEEDANTRVIAVTSGKGGVGKTNLTVNLAIALGMAGQRVIVFPPTLDWDLPLFQRPQQLARAYSEKENTLVLYLTGYSTR